MLASIRIIAVTLAVTASFPTSPAVAQETMPPGADDALDRLNTSARHGDWVTVRLEGGDSVRSWVVYPERSGPAPVVVVIHEIYALTGWVRAVADQLAADGFLAIAPDLLTMTPVPTDTNGDPERDAAVAAVRALDDDRVHRQIRAVAEYAMALPGAADVYGIVGYCWGGSTSFEHATRYADLGAAAVFYGGSPDEEALPRVESPVLGLYGSDDARVNATIPRAGEALPSLYRAVLFDGAGHGFLRAQDGREGANLAASERAWPMLIGFFHGALSR